VEWPDSAPWREGIAGRHEQEAVGALLNDRTLSVRGVVEWLSTGRSRDLLFGHGSPRRNVTYGSGWRCVVRCVWAPRATL